MSNVSIATNAISTMNSEELSEVIEAIKYRRHLLSKKAVRAFRYGDRVQFTGKRGRIVIGTVAKVNIKYVKVTASDGITWRVPAHMLSAAEVVTN